jgi:glutaredoxin
MYMMKNIFRFFIFVSFLFLFVSPARAFSGEVYFFYGDGCPHCAKEEVFLNNVVSQKYPDIKINRYEVWGNQANAKFLAEAAEKLNIKVSGVPILIVGDKAVVGFLDDKTSGAQIMALLDEFASGKCADALEQVVNNTLENQSPEEQLCEHSCDSTDSECQQNCGCSTDSERAQNISQKIKIPFFGEKDVKEFSLPILTVAVGVLDGFNPCAMWVLVFLITLLLGTANRKRMWILGVAFIITSGFVYFLFLSAWLNLFLFVGFLAVVRYAIGLVAIGSGFYHLKEYFTNKEAACKVTGGEKKKKIFDRLKQIISRESFVLSLLGIIILAAVVNLVELVCSAGLPAVYTQVLSLSNLPLWQYYGYLFLYIFFFMLDDLLIFFMAMFTLKISGINTKYTRYSNLIGGIIILIIGILLIFKPGWLMFG